MAKISLALVFALMVTVPFHSVLCQDDSWESIIDQAKDEASKAGLSQDTIFGAEKAITDGSAEKVAEDALGEGSLEDWVKQAKDMTKDESSPSGAPEDLPDDEEEDNLPEAPELAPKNAPSKAPIGAPTDAPSEAPSAAPQAQTPSATTL